MSHGQLQALQHAMSSEQQFQPNHRSGGQGRLLEGTDPQLYPAEHDFSPGGLRQKWQAARTADNMPHFLRLPAAGLPAYPEQQLTAAGNDLWPVDSALLLTLA